MDISGKKAIVFGGTSGIGFATIKMLAQKGASKILAVSRNPDKVEEIPQNVELVKLDVLDETGLKTFFKEQGEYDILINSATGGGRAIGPFLNMDMEGYRNSFFKLWGYTNVVRYGTEYLKNNGNIVLVSGSPARNCKPGYIALSSVGGAVEAFARGIAKEIKPKRINVVSPGTIDTPMSPLQGKEREDFYDNATKNNLIPRAGTSEEVAMGIIFCIENDFITGTTVDIDGGWLLS